MSRAWSRRQEEPSGQQVEPSSAKHLALQHLQAVDLPFGRSLAPGQRHPGLDRGIVPSSSFSKALEGREGARGGAYQPRVELSRLALTDEAGEVLRERDSLRQSGMCGELHQLGLILIRELVWRAEDQPGRPAGRERAPWRLSHRRQRLSTAPLSGG